jgi:hypothetical protein
MPDSQCQGRNRSAANRIVLSMAICMDIDGDDFVRIDELLALLAL